MQLAICWAFCAVVSGAPAEARTPLPTSCVATDAKALEPDDIRGVRTRWRPNGGNARFTVQPFLEGLSLAQWMQSLDAAHVNMADLNLDPREVFASESRVGDDELEAYLKAYYTPASQRSPDDAKMVERFEADVIAPNKLTPAQRDTVLIDFLSRLEALKAAGKIKGDIKFIVHQRQWFRPGDRPRLEALRAERRDRFVEDFSGLINRARSKCLDHWLAGVRLGENFNNHMDEFLPLLVDLAHGINQHTDGWLHTHLFVSNGGNMGADFSGISNVRRDPSGAAFDFLPAISRETGAFAFAYKWMRFISRDDRYIRTDMAQAKCNDDRTCDIDSVADWKTYLGRKLGLEEVIELFSKNANRFPHHANIIFAGDSSDSLSLLVQRDASGDLLAMPPLRAVRELWCEGSRRGRRGYEFMNGFSSDRSLPNEKLRKTPDAGFSLAYVSDGSVQVLSHSLDLWRRWHDVCH